MTNIAGRKGFTLIELLIVVAIIAILAAIAVPNFLEAQVRSKVSRAKEDMRSIAVALEAFAVDQNKYPDSGTNWPLPVLTTPIAYMTSIPQQPWRFAGYPGTPRVTDDWREYPYRSDAHAHLFGDLLGMSYGYPRIYVWALQCYGPDQKDDYGYWYWWPAPVHLNRIYDPTNGTVSSGDIIRWGP
jgi:prepilin-type N-terminal cleavage/methylation domain-containing protein